ncbi:hypothetical protein BXZ70DRAFT_668588 [Cristinia sonorae]|uniref:Uncharacterized protein n=1 Tax=Cristinia sonorae TaxID=1940300 RepID=A0A8K0UVQ7_9AGAR|nr:hypothetical protein BXZ70DRAFT_668588 [Cristinia sonorae]
MSSNSVKSPSHIRRVLTRARAAFDGNPKLMDCISEHLPGPPPSMLNHTVSSSTRGLTDTEKSFSQAQELKWVASFPNLVPLLREKLKRNSSFHEVSNRVLDLSNPEHATLFLSLHPDCTGIGLPPEIRSEADTTSHINAKLVWPAILIIQLMCELDTERCHLIPYVSSSEGKKGAGIPDGATFEHLGGKGVITLEWKTENAMPAKALSELVSALEELKKRGYSIPIRFWWPREGHSRPFAKCLSQVWGQMRNKQYNVIVATLSSLTETFFFYRHPTEHKNVLFMSSAVAYKDIEVLDFVAIFAFALGLTSLSDDELPVFDTERWGYLDLYYDAHPQKQPIPTVNEVTAILQQQSTVPPANAVSKSKSQSKPQPGSSNPKTVYSTFTDDESDVDATPKAKKKRASTPIDSDVNATPVAPTRLLRRGRSARYGRTD